MAQRLRIDVGSQRPQIEKLHLDGNSSTEGDRALQLAFDPLGSRRPSVWYGPSFVPSAGLHAAAMIPHLKVRCFFVETRSTSELRAAPSFGLCVARGSTGAGDLT